MSPKPQFRNVFEFGMICAEKVTSHSIVSELRPHLSGALIPSSQYISVKAGLAQSCCIDL